MKMRTKITASVRRAALLESGFRCSVPHCSVDSSLDFHHIDGDPANNCLENILVVCSNHHRACTSGRIDKKVCKEVKRLIRPKPITLPAEVLSIAKFKKILREELDVHERVLPRKQKKASFPLE